MKERVMIGIPAGILFLMLLFLGGWIYTGLIFVLAVIAYTEFCYMNNQILNKIQMAIGIGVIATIFVSRLIEEKIISHNCFPYANDENIMFGLLIFFVFIVLNKNQVNVTEVSYFFVGALYIGYGFSYMMDIIWQENGLIKSLLIFFIIWASDSGAYFIGRKWGEKRLLPEISPGKTIEGSLAGMCLGVIVSILTFLCFPKLNFLFPNAILLGIFISLSGQTGDLIESAIKRTANVKDSGDILPGHGGILDRFDSLIFTFIILHLVKII